MKENKETSFVAILATFLLLSVVSIAIFFTMAAKVVVVEKDYPTNKCRRAFNREGKNITCEEAERGEYSVVWVEPQAGR